MREHNDTNLGDPRDTPEEKEIYRLDALCKRQAKEIAELETHLTQSRKLYELTLNNEIRWMRKSEDFESLNALWINKADALEKELKQRSDECERLRRETEELREISSENLTELVAILDEYELSIGPNVTLRQVLASLTAERDRLKAEVERLTDAMSWSEAKAHEDAANLRIEVAQLQKERDKAREECSQHFEQAMRCTKENLLFQCRLDDAKPSPALRAALLHVLAQYDGDEYREVLSGFAARLRGRG